MRAAAYRISIAAFPEKHRALPPEIYAGVGPDNFTRY